jgi:hypothetical protein
MKTNVLIFLLEIAGVMHLGLMTAGLMMPSVVGMKTHLAVLPKFIRQLFWVYYSFIGLCLGCFGSITFFGAAEIASGGPLACAVCGLFTAFWTLRLVAATFVFDLRPYLTNAYRRVGYTALNLVFVYLLAVYVVALWKGVGR